MDDADVLNALDFIVNFKYRNNISQSINTNLIIRGRKPDEGMWKRDGTEYSSECLVTGYSRYVSFWLHDV